MDSPSLTVEQVERLANPALLNRYLSAVAVASLIYDHIRFLDTEISDVWVSLGTSTRLKLGFLVGRYAADAALLYTAYALSGSAGNLDLVGCRNWIDTYWAVQALCIATTQGIVIYRLKEIFGRNKASVLEAIPIVLVCIAVIMITLEVPNFFDALQYVDFWRMCGARPMRPIFTIVQFGSLAFADILVMLLFTIAVLEIPYTRSSEVLAKLQKDGGWYFLALFLIHITTIIVLTRGKMYFPVTLPLGWSLAMILTARIFHRIGLDKKRANEPPRAYLWHQDRLIRLTY